MLIKILNFIISSLSFSSYNLFNKNYLHNVSTQTNNRVEFTKINKDVETQTDFTNKDISTQTEIITEPNLYLTNQDSVSNTSEGTVNTLDYIRNVRMVPDHAEYFNTVADWTENMIRNITYSSSNSTHLEFIARLRRALATGDEEISLPHINTNLSPALSHNASLSPGVSPNVSHNTFLNLSPSDLSKIDFSYLSNISSNSTNNINQESDISNLIPIISNNTNNSQGLDLSEANINIIDSSTNVIIPDHPVIKPDLILNTSPRNIEVIIPNDAHIIPDIIITSPSRSSTSINEIINNSFDLPDPSILDPITDTTQVLIEISKILT